MATTRLYSCMEVLGAYVKNVSLAMQSPEEDEMCTESRDETSLKGQKTGSKLPASLIKSICEHPELKAYRFRQNDLYVIANIFQSAKEDFSSDYGLSEILAFLPHQKGSIQTRLKYVQGLVDREILSLCCTPDTDFHHDTTEFLQSRFHLNGFLWNILLGKSPMARIAASLKSLLAEETTFQDAVSATLDMLYDYYPELNLRLDKLRGIYYGKRLNLLLDMALEHLSRLDDEHPFQKLCREQVQDAFWQKCLLLIYRHYRTGDYLEITTLACLLSQNEMEYRQNLKRLRQDNLLKKSNLLEDSPAGFRRDSLELSEEGISFFGSRSISSGQDITHSVQESDFFDLLTPEQNLSCLVLPNAIMQSIGAIIHRLQNPERDVLQSWGLRTASLSKDQDIHGACNVLLHGGPGTGKTYIAGVIANELQRPLIQINASSIRNCYYGNTEKRARMMVQEMQDLAKQFHPVFLLNEGDQLIHHRQQGYTTGADNAENSIQSIFLEAMETFTGVLILTSNLVQNLDPAMSRRFHYKLQIPAPELAERIKLWKIHLSQSIPGAQDIDIRSLAESFVFTGGQISTVILNACHQAASRVQEQILLFSDLWH
ncbi:MAG: ATP-binding protein, partial [Candidatus Cloacimonadaceae bacterium]|nr:ATP-binding protein [Candidatus Cloacimonadaceae bacterium]